MNEVDQIINQLIGDAKTLPYVILLLPLTSFVVLFFFANQLKSKGDRVATLIAVVNFLLSLLLFIHTWQANVITIYETWFQLPTSQLPITFTYSIKVNDLSAMMLLLVNFISLLVHIYSLEYMKGKRNYARYYPYLGLFTFSMIGIVLSDNLLITFMFWEMVGFSSYLLIGFWYEKEVAMRAAKKAFLFNRIGDTGFIIGIIAFYTIGASFEISDLKDAIRSGGYDTQLFLIAGIGIFLGCIGKSAQFPLQAWLPDAMEGPTPASALIHAATMVAAGIYLLVKVHLLLSIEVHTIIAFVGAITAFMGAVPALFQTDIKKVLAFSTVSQLGYMVMAIGVQSYEASYFHLMTHGFFKACLFLSAGSIIHCMHEVKHYLFLQGHYRDFDSQDMRLMGGFRKMAPVTFYCYVISAASLIGLPFFSGFLSKDAILEGALQWASTKGGVYYLIPVLSLITVLLTAAYMARQIFLIFWGDSRLVKLYPESEDGFKNMHEASVLMKGPLVVLALLSLGFAFSLNPLNASDGWLFKIPGHFSTGLISTVLAVLGIGAGILLMQKEKGLVTEINESEKQTAGRFFKNNWMMDKIYFKILVMPGFAVSRVATWFDTKVIDNFIHFISISSVVIGHVIAWLDRHLVDGFVNLAAQLTARFGKILRAFQGGKVQGYFIYSMLVLVLIVLWIIIR